MKMLLNKLRKKKTIRRCKPFLGTYVEICMSGHKSELELIELSEQAFAEIANVEKRMSFHDQNSELSYINREAFYQTCEISPEMEEIISTALNLSMLTGGAYDIAISANEDGEYNNNSCWVDIQLVNQTIKFKRKMVLDLEGIAKGYAVDQAFYAIADRVDDLVINAGGDMRMKNWHNQSISVHSFHKDNNNPVDIPMRNAAASTSASHYIQNSADFTPYSSQKPNSKHSVTVFSSNCMWADALNKVVHLCENYADIIKIFNAEAALIDNHNNIASI